MSTSASTGLSVLAFGGEMAQWRLCFAASEDSLEMMPRGSLGRCHSASHFLKRCSAAACDSADSDDSLTTPPGWPSAPRTRKGGELETNARTDRLAKRCKALLQPAQRVPRCNLLVGTE
ncbi:hypothetical protein PHYPSEUDO_011803 [Phytophthora pseudosyringae]|uniref:Uncharacterized protein n=1 Tax=Phytophthora pseudosyringae TaxID=221518 RepID=A0A8T1W980_9STRA|nr:hypothetical protein PHYPSEUDO_011803 [Phytophthora pseudosyringae]